MWSRGDIVVLRYRKDQRLSHVTPVTMVEDSPETVAFYVVPDTPVKRRVGLDGAPIPRTLSYAELNARPWRLGDGYWRDASVLWIVSPGDAYSVGVFWRGPERAFSGWYVNLQAPLIRTRVGFDSADHVLDITVAPDGRWSWKDEDEFAEARAVGRFTEDEARRIRMQGEAVIALIEDRVWPFQPDVAAWSPDPDWKTPALPLDWDAE